MSEINHLAKIWHPHLPGVRVFPVTSAVESSVPQEVLVEVEPLGRIPLHRHSVDATMIIVGGSGRVLARHPQLDGAEVSRGAVVFFERMQHHGFEAGPDGLVFLSRNGGIVDRDSDAWDIEFESTV